MFAGIRKKKKYVKKWRKYTGKQTIPGRKIVTFENYNIFCIFLLFLSIIYLSIYLSLVIFFLYELFILN